MNAAAVRARLVGDRIELIRPIGEGGCSSVWLGRHVETNQLVAVKLAHSRDDHGVLSQRFRREAKLAARLTHRNLVRVYDYFREPDGQPVLLMELLRGQTLEELLQSRGALDLEAAVAVIIPVLCGLLHAHSLGILHRDLKPSNIFLAVEPDGVVIPKVLDFGIAKSLDSAPISITQRGEILGTPAYMSPEQIRGHELTAASDVFALGAVLYEMLTGAMAFSADTQAACLAAVLERPVERPAAIPEHVWPVIARALSKNSAGRHASLAELRWELEEATGYGDGLGQQALAELRIELTPLPLFPQLTPGPFHPSSSQVRVIAQDALTLPAPPSFDDVALPPESAPHRTSPPAWLLIAVALLWVCSLLILAWFLSRPSRIEAAHSALGFHSGLSLSP